MTFSSQDPHNIALELRQISTQALFLSEQEQRSLASDLENIFAVGEEKAELADHNTDPRCDDRELPYIKNARDLPADKLVWLEDKLSPALRTVRDNVLARIREDPETGIRQAECFTQYLLGDLAWKSLFERIAEMPNLQRVQTALSDYTLEAVRMKNFKYFGSHEPG
mgnify:CR=1 FL=1